MSDRPLDDRAFEDFAAKLEELYADFKGATVGQLSLTRKMMQTIKLVARSGITFYKDIFSIIGNLMYLDGMVLHCNPNAVLLRDMLPILVAFEKVL